MVPAIRVAPISRLVFSEQLKANAAHLGVSREGLPSSIGILSVMSQGCFAGGLIGNLA